MDDEQQKHELTQQTQPQQGEPVEILVPKERDVEDLIDRAAQRGQLGVPDRSGDDQQCSDGQ